MQGRIGRVKKEGLDTAAGDDFCRFLFFFSEDCSLSLGVSKDMYLTR